MPVLPAMALSFEQLGYTHGTQGKIGTRLPKPVIAVLMLNVLWERPLLRVQPRASQEFSPVGAKERVNPSSPLQCWVSSA